MTRFDKEIKRLIEEEADIPECLSTENIALMLKEKTAEKEKMQRTKNISVKSKNRAITIRSAAAVAACVALAVGIIAFVDDTEIPVANDPNITQDNKASDYHDVYSVIQDTIINNPAEAELESADEKYEHDSTADVVTVGNNPETERYSIPSTAVDGVESADIVKTDGTNLYCISNNSFYIISAEDGNMQALTKISGDGKLPVDMYIDGNKVVVISNNTVEVPFESSPEMTETTVSGESSIEETTTTTSAAESTMPETVTQTNTIVDIYDVSDKVSPKLSYSYKQNGAYVSSRMTGSSLYLVTNYSNFRTKPLDSETDLDNYIPSYYLNDTKCYINAEDIILPSSANGSYTVVSGLNIQNSAPLASIKAILSNGKSVYCTGNSLYTIGTTGTSTAIAKFTINDGALTYVGYNTVSGIYAGISAVTEIDGSLRLAAYTADNKTSGVNLYQFDANLNTFASLEKACEGQTIEIIRFSGSDVYIATAEKTVPIKYTFGSDISQATATESDEDFIYLKKLNDTYAIELSAVFDENGTQTGLRLTSLKTSDGINYTEVSSAEMTGTITSSFNSRSLYIDAEKSVIGIPTTYSDTYGCKNMYYVFSFDTDATLTQIGALEYTDIDSTFEFSRAFRVGDTLYIYSAGRIVSAQLSDLKVIGTLELK